MEDNTRSGKQPPPGSSSSKGGLSMNERSIFNVPKKGSVRPEHHSGRVFTPPGSQVPVAAEPPAAPAFFNLRNQLQSHEKLSKLMQSWGLSEKPASSATRPVPSGPPAPQPARGTYSSLGGPGFMPINIPPSNKSIPTIDLRTPPKSAPDDDDEFDPDAQIQAERPQFGAADPYEYVNPEDANKNLKALLSGAFDDEEDEDGARRRKLPRVVKRTATEVAKSKAKSLAEKLHILEKAEEENAKDEKTEEDEEDDGVVEGLKVRLLPHQVDGVAWMIDREAGKKKKGVLPMGGILADDMGLGKTIQSIALILMNPRPTNEELAAEKKSRVALKSCSTTLVIAPLALIRQWESEINTKSSDLTVFVHHGSNRTTSSQKLLVNDVVVTTYQTVMSEVQSGGALKGIHWYRIILDEAHTIKNRNAKTTQACYELDSVYRWCLTGTPMQNNLDELQSLIKFLKIKPYNDPAIWKAQITEPLKRGRGGLSFRRLRIFLKACMKRRTKDVLKKDGALGKSSNMPGEGADGVSGFKIVGREVKTLEVHFSPAEKRFYDKLMSRAQDSLEEMMAGEKQDYIGALVLLLRLRQVCNHPYLMRARMEKDRDALSLGTQRTEKREAEAEVDDLANLLGGLSVKQQKCDVCKSHLSKVEIQAGDIRCRECEADFVEGEVISSPQKKSNKMSAAERLKLRAARQRRVVVDSDDENSGEWLTRDRSSKDGQLGTDDEDDEGGGKFLGDKDSDTEDEEEEEKDLEAVNIMSDPRFDPRKHALREGAAYPSTKVSHLLKILQAETPEHKVIVFSQFTSMLDIMEPFLRAAHHKFVRYDGSMKNDEREASLHALRSDSRVRVLLCSLKCGSLGLNLTAASRVVIMEPFWNPFVEEQAIDRVHRLNQTRDVVVHRLTISNSVEERILVLQEAKRKLAAAAFGPEGGKGIAKLSMADILALFRHDAHHEDEHDKNGSYERVKVLGGGERGIDADVGAIEKPKKPQSSGMPGDWKRGFNEDGAYGRR